jgi:dTDP-4-dehydrorhamnose 3,5-epimerase
MRFTETTVHGAYLIDPEPRGDERGFFARLWCRDEFAAHGLTADFVQCNDSFSVHRGTLRGLHYQAAPFGEVKLVRCVRGSVFDVLVDLHALVWRGADG